MRKALELVSIEEYENSEIIFNRQTKDNFAYFVLIGQVYLVDSDETPSEDDLVNASKATVPKFKKIEVGGLVGAEAFLDETEMQRYLHTAVAYNSEGPTILLRID